MIPTDFLDLLEGRNTAVLVTIGPDGSPQAAPVWFLWADGAVHLSTRSGMQKHRNVQRDPRVSFTVVDPANPMRYIEIRATVELGEDPDYTLRDGIVRKHGFADGSAFDPPGTHRVHLTLRPQRVVAR